MLLDEASKVVAQKVLPELGCDLAHFRNVVGVAILVYSKVLDSSALKIEKLGILGLPEVQSTI